MYKLLLCSLAVIILFTSCHTRDHSEALKAINNGFVDARAILLKKNEDIYETLVDKREDPLTQTKANVWEPKALVVKKLSAGIKNYISNLQNQLGAVQQDAAGAKKLILEMGDSLYARLVRYNTAVVQVLNPEEFSDNPMIETLLRKDIENFQKDISARSGIRPGGMHGKITNLQNWKRVYLDEGSPILVTAMLNKIVQDVLITENGMIEYINSNLIHNGCGLMFEKFQAIAVLSSSYIKAGQEIEVVAGLGVFSPAVNPIISINGIKMRLNYEGVALYKLKATSKPGKYTVPVRFDYIQSDGSRAYFTKKLEYIIAE